MIFTELPLRGGYQVDIEPITDERGAFARIWCEREFRKHGLRAIIAQSSVSFNRLSGTVRGMHFQIPPYAETKIVRCTRGRIFDVLVDLRPESPTFKKWMGVELGADTGRMTYIPEGFAHGFQTLEDDSEVQYLISEAYSPEASRGIRWNDPAIDVHWPLPVRAISSRDETFPPFQE